MGGVRNRDASRGGGWLYTSGRHASELPSRDHDSCCAGRQASRGEGQMPRRLEGLGGLVGDSQINDKQNDIASLARAGVPGFKCFLINPGIDGFTMVTEQQLRAALPHIARTGLPLLVHAELPGRLIAQPKCSPKPAGIVIRPIFIRGPTKRNWLPYA